MGTTITFLYNIKHAPKWYQVNKRENKKKKKKKKLALILLRSLNFSLFYMIFRFTYGDYVHGTYSYL
jgi:hypothetical protein